MMRRRLSPITALAVVAAGACTSPTAPAFSYDKPPTSFTMQYGGFGFGSHDVELRNDALIVVRRSPVSSDAPVTSYVVPTPAQWRAFWRDADAAGVRRWRRSCRNEQIVDGGGFTLEIAYDGGRVTAEGANAYPQRDGACSGDGAHSPEFDAFLAAISRLIGRSYP